MTSVLLVLGGRPATGKSSVAGLVARRLRAPYLRLDRIEYEIAASRRPVGEAGYRVAYALAGEQLSLGLDTVVECVNPLAITRDAWLAVAEATHAALVEVEFVCGDPAEHRRRVESRESDVEGLVKPTWEQVVTREYEPWQRPHLVVDTASTSCGHAAEQILGEVTRARPRRPASARSWAQIPSGDPKLVGCQGVEGAVG